jgi:hypothetical protein
MSRMIVFIATFCLLALVSGMVNGLHETLSHHYGVFNSMFPAADPFYWNPAISWVSKYEGGIPAQGPAYLGSTTFLVFLTDAYHLTNLLVLLLLTGAAATAGVIARHLSKRPVRLVCLFLTTCLLLYAAGFHFIYSLLFG